MADAKSSAPTVSNIPIHMVGWLEQVLTPLLHIFVCYIHSYFDTITLYVML